MPMTPRMQLAAFFLCSSHSRSSTLAYPCGEPSPGRLVTGEGPPSVQWLEPIVKRLPVLGRSHQQNRTKEVCHGKFERNCEHPWNYQGSARGYRRRVRRLVELER